MFTLTWNDINLDNAKIKINKQVAHSVGNRKIEIITPKTSNSIRILDIPNILLQELKKHYEQQKNIYDFKNTWFAFGNIKPPSYTTLARYLDKYTKLSDIKKLTPHGFRHSHTSLLINLGCDFLEVAERLGDDPETIRNTYYHMFPDKKSNSVNLLNQIK